VRRIREIFLLSEPRIQLHWRLLCGLVTLLLLDFFLFASLSWSESLRPVTANPNHIPGGVLRDGVLRIQLEIARGEWHPEADDGVALNIYAFGEAGGILQNPGPLIRVPQGTEIRASLNNRLAVPIAVHGLGNSSDATVHIAPGSPGTFSETTRRRCAEVSQWPMM
jgi:FtsP/CotA-like multicopper oxidase with cupredoxin domain